MADGGSGQLTISVAPEGDAAVVRLVGELDMAEAPALTEAFAAVDAPSIVVDLSGLTFLDSSGLRVLVLAHRADRPLTLRSPSVAVARALTVSGVDQLLRIDEG